MDKYVEVDVEKLIQKRPDVALLLGGKEQLDLTERQRMVAVDNLLKEDPSFIVDFSRDELISVPSSKVEEARRKVKRQEGN